MIYLDNAATTPPLAEVVDYAKKYIDDFYNPSALYVQGLEVSKYLKVTRERLSSFICPKGYECIFTSGGSESDNTAIFSCAKRGNIVTTLGEHSAVYEAVKSLDGKVVECRYATLNPDGSVCVEDLLSRIDEKTTFVSVVHVNNETGAVNDINHIAAQVKKINQRILFHSDGVQAFGKIPFRLSPAIDFYSVSAHKIGAMKGCGALFKSPRVSLHPLIYGGGQESGYRSGTENVFGIAALHRAADIKYAKISENYKRIAGLKQRFEELVTFDKTVISPASGSPYIYTFALAGLKGEVLQHMLEKKGLIVGTGSACSSKSPYSRIIKACGYSNELLDGVLRISFSPENTEEEIVKAAECVNLAVSELRRIVR